MNYMIYAKPEDCFSKMLKLSSNGYIPGLGYHVSLAFFESSEVVYKSLFQEMKYSYISPIQTKTTGFDQFDNSSQVLCVKNSERLQTLHENMVDIARRYTDLSFEETVTKYYLERFNPHITVGKGDSQMNEDSGLINIEFNLNRLAIAKKTEKGWKDFFVSKIRG